MSVSDEVERAAADTTSSDCVISATLPPLVPIGFKNRPVGVALPLRRDSAMEEVESVDQDPSNLAPKQLGQELAPDYLKTIDSSSDDSICSNENSPRTPFDHTHHIASQCPLPYNKKYHVFITHSTFDTHLIKPKLVESLTGPPRYLRVCCSSDFMKGSEYNNDAIKSMMQQSCVIVIGVSEPYIKSSRCDKEWKRAVEHTRNIIVIALGPCSRPREIKHFLYLDFIDDSKRKKVCDIFMKEIGRFISLLQEQFRPPSPRQADNFGMTQLFDSMSTQHTDKQGSGLWNTDVTTDQQSWNTDVTTDQQGWNTDVTTDQQGWNTDVTTDQQGWNTDVTTDQQSSGLWNTDVTTDHHEGEEMTGEGFEENFMEMDFFHRPFEGGNGEEVGFDTSSNQGGGAKCSDEESEEGEGVKNEDELAVMVEGEEAVGNKERGRQREEGELSDTGSPDEEGREPTMKCPKLEEGSADEETSQSQEVAGFYNSLAKPGADNRNESPIFHMRNFNNWVKSILIRTFLKSRGMAVLDLCCGKGGDLNKWKEGGISHVVCADISEVSIQRCKERYESRKMYYRRQHAFNAQFIVGDCCEVQLREKYDNPARRFGMTSCQFSLHYSFESYERATMMLRNACENLIPGGYFIGTTVDANELVRRVRENGCRDDTGAWSVGNDLYSVTFDEGIDPHNDSLPLFNCKYHFKLEGVVNVPEYLVHFPLLVKMLKEFGMKEVLHQNLYDFFYEHRHNPEDLRLLYNMHAFDKHGTMTRSQWEAIGLYLVFVFQKEQH